MSQAVQVMAQGPPQAGDSPFGSGFLLLVGLVLVGGGRAGGRAQRPEPLPFQGRGRAEGTLKVRSPHASRAGRAILSLEAALSSLSQLSLPCPTELPPPSVWTTQSPSNGYQQARAAGQEGPGLACDRSLPRRALPEARAPSAAFLGPEEQLDCLFKVCPPPPPQGC